MIWLALYCPTLALDCILRRWPEGVEPAMAVTDVDGTRRFIAATTRTAQACGVFAGQSVATALALLPDLLVVARKLEDERRALTDAALAALRFTPTVSLRASGLVMELSASVKLFGGRRALKKDIASTMRLQGLRIAAAEAPTPHGAWLLAKEKASRHFQEMKRTATQARKPPRERDTDSPRERPASISSGTKLEYEPECNADQDRRRVHDREQRPFPPISFDTALDAVPVAHLESLGPSARRMDGIGLYTFADLRRLPSKGLARRFGEGLIDELARAAGDKPDPQVVFEAPSRFTARIELMARVETAEALVFASQRLLAQLAGWLAIRRAAVRGFTLVLHHDRWTRDAIEPTAVAIALATPSSDLARIVTLVRERLSRLELKAPVLELSLDAPTIVEEQEAHGTLFPEREEATETLARLLEKLIARLGQDAMCRVERVADHRPERAWREVRGDALQERVARTSATATMRAKKEPVRLHARPAKSGRDDSIDGSVRGSMQSAGNNTSSRLRERWSGRKHAGSKTPGVSIDAMPDIGTAHRPITSGCSCGPRPAWLLTEPRQLEVRVDRPIFESLPLFLMAGPERIETGWWDDAPATRDYFIAENAAGQLVWIYRERLVEPHRPLWYLQGVFA